MTDLTMTAFAREMLDLGRNDQPGHLYFAWRTGEIDDATLRDWILPTWQLTEFPASLGHSVWLESSPRPASSPTATTSRQTP
jgi:hypothetical protein